MGRGPINESIHPLVFTVPLIGRNSEVATLKTLLDRVDVRLVTLTGPGGIGKTRLALKMIDLVASTFPDGTSFVDLASIQDPAFVLPTIGQVFGLRDTSEQPVLTGLIRLIGAQRRLLVLDSFEHVMVAAPAISELLAACPNLTTLVTSREALRLSGEYEFPVPPLPLPITSRSTETGDIPDSPAVELFIQRARSVRPDFSLTAANAVAIASICARLDGLPLAIELAAARSKVLSPAALLQRLSHRLTLLTGGPRDAPNRLRTMRDAISWSYELLTANDQTLFRRLSIFAGTFTEDAATAVATSSGTGTELSELTVFEGISSLIDKSLIQQREGDDGEPRYGMLETVRDFGLAELDRTGETATIRAAVTNWAVTLGDDIEQHIHRPFAAAWLNRVQIEQDNLRLVLGWLTAADRDDGDLLRLVSALWAYWFNHGSLSEGRRWLGAALARSVNSSPEQRMPALIAAGLLAMAQGDFAAAETHLEPGRAIAVELGHEGWVAFARFGQGVITQDLGDAATARDHFLAALDAARAAQDDRLIAVTLNNLGLVVSRLGDHETGRSFLEDALHRHQTARYGLGEALSLRFLGQIAQAQGDFDQAAKHYRASLRFDPSELQSWHIAGSLEGLAASIAPLGEPNVAAQLLGAAEAIRNETGISVEPALQAFHTQAVAAIRARIGDEPFARETTIGRTLSRSQAIAVATQIAPEPPGATSPTVAPQRTSSTSPTGDSLTAREMEILRLLADGLSTREIADRLFISHRTVSTHTTNLLGKLQVDTRAAAIAYGHRSGLLSR